ncbi:hypothetical protein C6P44_001843 [Monosporozyma unispora]|nr:hypothetical protein C6P44_001843 [Kazachstania unispora]
MGQFVTLGVVLVGLLARCRSLLLQLQPEEEIIEIKKPVEINNDIIQGISSVDEDLGLEIIEDMPVEEDVSLPKLAKEDLNKTKRSKKTSKKKKGKKSKSAIDSIFG